MDMSLDDFDRCTPLEFEGIFTMWHAARQQSLRTSWEQTRQLAFSMLRPYIDKGLTARDVMEFEWDREEAAAAPQHSGQKAGTRRGKTAAERQAEKLRYEAIKKARGLT